MHKIALYSFIFWGAFWNHTTEFLHMRPNQLLVLTSPHYNIEMQGERRK